MTKFFRNVVLALKGFAMGAANVIPGVSGGTIALLTGIFTELIDALNAVLSPAPWRLLLRGKLREFWTSVHGTFLFWLAVGVLVSVFSLAKLMTFLLARHPVQTWAFFFGLIVVSAVYMLADIKGWRFRDGLFLAAGVALGVTVCLLPAAAPADPAGRTLAAGNYLYFALCGAIAICTMILPGISGSFILVILGEYGFIMHAVGTLDAPVLAAFAVGCVAGLRAFSKFLHWLLARYERPTLLVLIGFTLGALVKVWPWNDPAAVSAANTLTGTPGALHIPGALLWGFAGVVLVVLLERTSRRGKSAEK